MIQQPLPRFFQIEKLFILLIISFFIAFGCTTETVQQEEEKTYTNPVIMGDFPDPSIIRVEDTFYAVGTTNDFAPNYPIYESTDLVNWTRIASVFSEPPAWASEDFWAPELFYKEGTFYVYYTTKRKDNGIACIGVATAEDITKGFTDHGIIIEWGEEAIDAYVFQDEDDKLYISWKAYGLTEGRDIEILSSELSADGLSLVGEHWTLTDFTQGWTGAGDEGQSIVKRGEYYYMFYSIGGCCDNKCDYRVMVSRSKDLHEGWEQFPEPILQGGEEWRCPGHGTLVQTADNRDFYMYHSYNATDFEFIGRQGMLDEIVWDEETAWPHFKNGNTPSEEALLPFQNTQQEKITNWEDDSSSDKNLAFWEWDVKVAKPNAKLENGELLILPSHTGVNFLGLRPKMGDYSMVTEVKLSESQNGIGVYSNQEHVLAITTSNSEVQVYKIQEGNKEVLAKESRTGIASIFLKYEARDGRYYKFYWSTDETNWQEMKIGNAEEFDASFIAQWGFSPRAGFIVDGKSTSPAVYSFLKVGYVK